MGESKGGRGGTGGTEPTKVLRQLVDEYSSMGITVAEIRLQRITENVYAVEVHEHGSHVVERFMVRSEGAR